ncbi:MAG: hypothetical protein HYV63_34655 [Candidatus Schekmanbacteria bacterium]|nr:hypothetical protein [Candidatus Schekmanbacteria bacterium]
MMPTRAAATRALLLSAVVFPGLGQWSLGQRWRAAALGLAVCAALAWLMAALYGVVAAHLLNAPLPASPAEMWALSWRLKDEVMATWTQLVAAPILALAGAYIAAVADSAISVWRACAADHGRQGHAIGSMP